MRKPTEMELRVARAIHEGWLPSWDQCMPSDIQHRIEQARKAIRAIREPTQEMWDAWRSVNCEIGTDGMEEFTRFYGDYGNWLACHSAMIDAASPALENDNE